MTAGDGSRSYGDALDTHKLKVRRRYAFQLQAEADYFTDSRHQFVEGLCLCAASGKLGDGCDSSILVRQRGGTGNWGRSNSSDGEG